MPNLLEGKTALVLGLANRWSIAYAIAAAFKREGAELLVTYQGERQRETVEELAAELGAAKCLCCDVSRDEDLDKLAETFREANITLDAVVHSIAFANREDLAKPFVETSRAGFALAADVSAYSLVAVARVCKPFMTRGGAVLTLSYLGAVRVVENYNVMGVAKAALEASVRYLAADFGARNIRINALSAGPIRTLAGSGIGDARAMFAFQQKNSPLGRGVTLEELGGSALYLLSNLSGGVTGEVHYVDSGYNIISMPRPETLKD